MRIYGFDISLTESGFVCLDGRGNIRDTKLCKTKSSQDIEDRILYIYSDMATFLGTDSKEKNVIICIEGLAFGSRGQKMFQLAGLHYYLRTRLYDLNVPFHIVPPTQVKKFIMGKGTARKEHMLLGCFKKYGIEFSNNNLCDAYCLARYGLKHFPIKSTTKLERRN